MNDNLGKFPPLEKDEEGYTSMNEKNLLIICEKDGFYRNPELNTKLLLQYKGFGNIQNLDKYKNLVALWLNNNAISQIENLSHLKSLNSLFLNKNAISNIQGVNQLQNLAILDLSYNSIRKIEGLDNLPNLVTLNICHNHLTGYDSLEGLLEAKTLTNIDASFNPIEHEEKILNIFTQMSQLKLLNLRGTEFQRKFSQYRKKFITHIKSLLFLDDRPVSETERALAEGFIYGGKQGMEDARQKVIEKKLDKQQRQREFYQSFNKKHEEAVQEHYQKLKLKTEQDIQKLEQTIVNMIKDGAPEQSIDLIKQQITKTQKKFEQFKYQMETDIESVNLQQQQISENTEDEEIPKTFTVQNNPDGTVTLLNVPKHLEQKVLDKYFNNENIIRYHPYAKNKQQSGENLQNKEFQEKEQQQEEEENQKQLTEEEQRLELINQLVEEYNDENQSDLKKPKTDIEKYNNMIKRPYYGYLKEDTERELEEVQKQKDVQEIIYRKPVDLEAIKERWIPDQDELLENLLENYDFDFEKTTRDFNKISKKVLKEQFTIDFNIQELRQMWTHIEKNRYRDVQFGEENEDDEDNENNQKNNILDKQEREAMLKEIQEKFKEDQEQQSQLNFEKLQQAAEQTYEKMEGKKLYKEAEKEMTKEDEKYLEDRYRKYREDLALQKQKEAEDERIKEEQRKLDEKRHEDLFKDLGDDDLELDLDDLD